MATTIVGTAPGPLAAQSAEDDDTGTIWMTIGANRSDNIRQAPVLEQSGSYKSLGLVSDWNHTSSRLDASLSSDLEYRDYSVDEIPNEVYGFADLSLEVHAVPERFSWLASSRIAQARPDAFQIDRPENREAVHILSTGPRLLLPMGRRTSFRLERVETRRSVDHQPLFDSDVGATTLAVLRRVSETTEVSLQSIRRDIEYSDPMLDKELSSTYLSFDRVLVNGTTSIAIGSSTVDFGQDDRSTTFVDAEWIRQLGTRSRMTLSFGRDFVDSFQDSDYYDQVDLILSADVYKREALGLDFELDFSRSNLRVGAHSAKLSYVVDNAFDHEEETISADFLRSISSRLELGFGAYLSGREYRQLAIDDDHKAWQVSLRRLFTGPFSLRFVFDHLKREGLQSRGIDENTISVHLRYDIKG